MVAERDEGVATWCCPVCLYSSRPGWLRESYGDARRGIRQQWWSEPGALDFELSFLARSRRAAPAEDCFSLKLDMVRLAASRTGLTIKWQKGPIPVESRTEQELGAVCG